MKMQLNSCIIHGKWFSMFVFDKTFNICFILQNVTQLFFKGGKNIKWNSFCWKCKIINQRLELFFNRLFFVRLIGKIRKVYLTFFHTRFMAVHFWKVIFSDLRRKNQVRKRIEGWSTAWFVKSVIVTQEKINYNLISH